MKKFETKGLGRATASLVIGLALVAGFAASPGRVPRQAGTRPSPSRPRPGTLLAQGRWPGDAASVTSLTVRLANGSSETLAIDSNTTFFEAALRLAPLRSLLASASG